MSDAAGLSEVPLDGERASFLYVPRTAIGRGPLPLLLVLHGAGGNAHHALGLVRPQADAQGIALLAPASRGFTWDIVLDDYGPDIARIDRALRHAFTRCAVQTARLGIAGFSDGASYALSVGLSNGDLFTHLIAFSPGFAAPPARVDRPRVFVAHGTGDEVLPIARCSRLIVPRLRREGLQVEYFEFEGGHQVPRAIAQAALHWFVPSP
jgi:phospholipase/carboxylesterase